MMYGALLFASTTADNLLAFDAASGVLRWLPVAAAPAPALAAPAVTADAVVVVALFDGTVFAAASGGKMWAVQLDGPVVAPPTLGAAGTAFVGTLNGTLYALDVERCPTGADLGGAAILAAIGPHVLARASVMGTYTIASDAVDAG